MVGASDLVEDHQNLGEGSLLLVVDLGEGKQDQVEGMQHQLVVDELLVGDTLHLVGGMMGCLVGSHVREGNLVEEVLLGIQGAEVGNLLVVVVVGT